jgi:cysteinyl-tRNA synthetase
VAARSTELPAADRRDLLIAFDHLLGLSLDVAEPTGVEESSDPRIDALLAERESAREARDGATADRIRDELAAEGITIVDTPEGPR